MKHASESKYSRDEVLSKCFECLVSNGLEKTTTRSFSVATGLSSSSLYYWFRDKDEIVLDATLFGLNTIIDDLFTEAYSYLNDLDTLFKKFPQAIATYKKHLRLIYQVLVSPQYGEQLRAATSKLSSAYDSYARVLADRLRCNYDDLCPFVHLFISVSTNFVLWEDEAKAIRQYEGLYQGVNLMIFSKQQKRDDYGAE